MWLCLGKKSKSKARTNTRICLFVPPTFGKEGVQFFCTPPHLKIRGAAPVFTAGKFITNEIGSEGTIATRSHYTLSWFNFNGLQSVSALFTNTVYWTTLKTVLRTPATFCYRYLHNSTSLVYGRRTVSALTVFFLDSKPNLENVNCILVCQATCLKLMASGINIYSFFFQIFKKYSGYPKKNLWYLKYWHINFRHLKKNSRYQK